VLSDDRAEGWHAYISVDFDRDDRHPVPEFSVFCPDCAGREFGE
jgi:hypothetical protein